MCTCIKSICIFVLLTPFILSQPKDVDGWQKVKWGMSMNEVATLYDLTIKSYNRDSLYLKNQIEILGDECEVTYTFDEQNNLMKVTISHPEKLSKSLSGIYSMWSEELTKKYGKPVEGENMYDDPYWNQSGVGEAEEKQLFWYFPSTEVNLWFWRLQLGDFEGLGSILLRYEKKTLSDDF